MEKNGINILLVEDNPADAKLVSEMLKERVGLSFRMTHAVRIDEALNILKGEKFDVVLLDLNLPDSQGLDGIEKITVQEPTVPVIILTGLDDEKIGIKAMRKHAGDYLVKGQINSNILARSIRYAIERKRAEQALRESREDLNRAQAVGKIGNWRLNIQQNELIWSEENYRIFGVPKGTPLAYETFISTVHPDDRDYVDKKWKAGMAGKDYDIEHRIIADGKLKWVREKAFMEFDKQGVLIAGFGITQDITTRRLIEEELRKSRGELEIRVQERTKELKTLFEALQDEMTERKQSEEKLKTTNALLTLFSQKPSRKDYLDAVVDLLHSWSGCRCVGIRILNDQGYIPYESYIGFSREFWESENRLSIEHDQCVCIRVVTGNPDPQDDSVMTPGGSFHCNDTVAFVGRLSAEEKARFRGVCIQNGFLSLNVIPIRYGEKVLGTIHLADKERKKLSLSFIEFLESMTPLIGEAINRFMLEDELRESETRLKFLSCQLLSVQEDERKRISAELHDDIAAKLAAIKFSLEKKLLRFDKANDDANRLLHDIISMVVDTIGSTRRIMVNLRPAMIDDLGILATLNWYCREFEQIFTTIQVKKQTNIEEIEIPENLKIVIFRIVQEGMNNIAKHSGANRAALTLEKINDCLTLSIEDNGRGFDVENKPVESEIFQSFGMLNMQERARFSGGDFSIKSLKEKGTSIKVSWSLKPIAMDYHLRIEPS
jgi:signal transduction histidine kinase/DNA-binding response OmpR family regulator